MSKKEKLEWSEEELSEICKYAMTPAENRKDLNNKVTYYGILIGGKRYITASGKGVWTRKNHATSALNNHISHFVTKLAQKKIAEKYNLILDNAYRYSAVYKDQEGNRKSLYDYPEFNNYYTNLIKDLQEREIIQIVELKAEES